MNARRPRAPKTIRRRSATALVTVVGVLIASFSMPSLVVADHDADAAEAAARDIAETQRRADEAAAKLFDTAGLIAELDADIAEAEVELGVAQRRFDEITDVMQRSAVNRFVAAGPGPTTLFGDVTQAQDDLTANVLAQVASADAFVDRDEVDEAREQLDRSRERLEVRRRDAAQAREDYTRLKETAESELVRLQELEALRQRDAAVQHEYERLERERQAREAAEREAAAAREAAEREAAERDRVAREAAGNQANGAGNSDSSTGAQLPAPDTTPGTGTDDGQDGSNSGGNNSPPPAVSGIVCPIAGPNAFGDTWGDARSGGRSHEGVDMMSPGGTPIVAVESGTVQFKTNTLGGNVIWLAGASGTKYYYAHLSAWEGSSRRVGQGEVIGYVGATGNTTANHLHLEIHPGGALAVNPYPYVRAVC